MGVDRINTESGENIVVLMAEKKCVLVFIEVLELSLFVGGEK